MLKRLARACGYSLNKLNKTQSPSDYFYNLLARVGFDCVVDCGANEGQFYRTMREAGFKGRYIAVEPNRQCLQTLNDHASRDANLSIVAAGVGDEPGTATLFESGSTGDLSSTLPQTQLMSERFRGAEPGERYEIRVCPLSELLSEHEISTDARLFLKLDTQGSDLKAWTGLGARRAQVAVLKAEMAVQLLYEGAPAHWEILDVARADGLEPDYFATISRDLNGGLIEYDTVFVRKALER